MANMAIPNGMTLDTLCFEWPDEPLPNISGFSTLPGQGSVPQVSKLNDWIEPQRTCGIILKHHGPDGLRMVLEGIARASVKLGVPMRPRVQSIADYLGIT